MEQQNWTTGTHVDDFNLKLGGGWGDRILLYNIMYGIYKLVLDLELPMAPVGPLGEYHPPIVLHTSILTPLSFSILWEIPVPLCTTELFF
jgi:hypothetical protein